VNIVYNHKYFVSLCMFKKLIATTIMAASFSGYACTIEGTEGIVPENDLWLSPDSKGINTMDEATFNAVIDKVEAVYAPVITSLGATLAIARNWSDGTVNAYASRSGDTWNVAMFGGLARHSTITEDGFALVVCHEVGHHIGGAPKKSSWQGTRWATNEGQADYFATLKCLRKTFRGENNIAKMAKVNVPAEVVQTCAAQFTTAEEQAICQRGSMAGMSTAKLFQDLRNQTQAPEFSTPDANTVSRTNHNHPATQCRLDTYFSGAICNIDDMQDVDQTDEAVAVCYRDAGDAVGVRPLCWFAPAK
jgi:hypothetical protein